MAGDASRLRGIAEQAQIETALRESQEHLQGILASAMDSIITIDDQQRILLFNRAAEAMFGYPAVQMIGERLEILLPERYRQAHREHIQNFGHTGVTNRAMGHLGALYGLRANGEEFLVEASISQVKVENGHLYTVILRDVTHRITAERALEAKTEELKVMSQQLWHTAKLATMGELAASIAHELNNPLAILSLHIEALREQAAEGSPERDSLEVMEGEVDRMASMVANLLQFSRTGERQISSLDVREEIERTLELLHSYLLRRHVHVERVYASQLPLIQADRQQLRQLFLNLFTNASDAMPTGGTLTIRIENQTPQNQIAIAIRDTGEGIAPENLSQVMEPFFTTKTEGRGTGLGLAICRRIVEEHQGSLQITSPGVGQGTTVSLYLPGQRNEPGSIPQDQS